MPVGNESIEISALRSIGQISATEWDACAGSDNPFVSHAFLNALEQSGAANAATGWHPHHLVARADGLVMGCVPLYVKSHSYGEYIFDWAWADWLHQHGKPYYPKLQCAVPFSPVTGPRLLTGHPHIADALTRALLSIAQESGVSSLHITFPTQKQALHLEQHGFMLRQGLQFQWINRGYSSFDDFLSDLSSRKRKQIKKERQAVARTGIVIDTLVGADITPNHWDNFFRFYLTIVDSKSGGAYLNREFFEALSASALQNQIVLMIARDGATPIAGAFNMLGSDTLFGRNWGAVQDVPFLHFEACYYRALDFAIDHRLARVEAGAQGAHKLDRGYLPTPTWSAHWIADPAFAKAVAAFLTKERAAIDRQIDGLTLMGPFRKEG